MRCSFPSICSDCVGVCVCHCWDFHSTCLSLWLWLWLFVRVFALLAGFPFFQRRVYVQVRARRQARGLGATHSVHGSQCRCASKSRSVCLRVRVHVCMRGYVYMCVCVRACVDASLTEVLLCPHPIPPPPSFCFVLAVAEDNPADDEDSGAILVEYSLERRLATKSLSMDDFQILSVIGKGSFGKVCSHGPPCTAPVLPPEVCTRADAQTDAQMEKKER